MCVHVELPSLGRTLPCCREMGFTASCEGQSLRLGTFCPCGLDLSVLWQKCPEEERRGCGGAVGGSARQKRGLQNCFIVTYLIAVDSIGNKRAQLASLAGMGVRGGWREVVLKAGLVWGTFLESAGGLGGRWPRRQLELHSRYQGQRGSVLR